MNRKIILILIFFLSCSVSAQQIIIPKIEQMPDIPAPFQLPAWKAIALGYDSLIYDFNKTGQYLPLIWLNTNTINYPSHNSFGLHTVVGTTSTNSVEAINVLPSLIGATLCGVDKSNQSGYNFVLMSEEFFNKKNGLNLYLNHPSASTGDDWWYETMPNIFFYQLYNLYPNTGDFKNQFTIVANRWLEAVNAMGGSTTPWKIPYMNYRAFNFSTMKGISSGVAEPEAAGAIAWILYNAFIETGNEEYRIGAELAMEFLNNLNFNPSYEIQMPYGAYAAARMNAELGTNYNIEKMINWCFSNYQNRDWGTIIGNWGGNDVHGLIGEVNGINDYAFLMNTFEQGGALVPLVRYDDRFAYAIGKWMLNTANAARLFYPEYLPDNKQDNEQWSKQYDPNSYIAYEALRQSSFGVSPYATGDAVSGGWGQTNLALYASSHVGIFGGIIDTTDVPGILKLDLLKTDYFHKDAYPTYLLYNPYEEDKIVTINVGSAQYDIYNSVENTVVANNVSGDYQISIPNNNAVLAVIIPSASIIEYDLNKTLANGIVIDYNSGQSVSNYPPRIKAISSVKEILIKNEEVNIFCTAEDKDNDLINFRWEVDGGTISGTGNSVSWKAPDSEGTFFISCIIDDSKSGKDTAAIFLNVVEEINNPPVIIKILVEPRKLDLGTSALVQCIASDPDKDQLNFTWFASSGSFNEGDSIITWTAPQFAGNYIIKCKVNDGREGEYEDSIAVSVRDFSNAQTGNLIAFYPFNENANDESGNNNNGTVSGAVLTSDRFGNQSSAYYFDGINDFIRITNNTGLNFQSSITINFWIKLTQFFEREQYPISHGNWENRWKISITNNRIRWTIRTDKGIKDIDSETVLELNKFYNVCTSYDGSDFEVYVNGNLDAFTSFSGNILPTTYALTVGQVLPDNNNYNFKGILDEIRIYDYALPFPEIQKLYDVNTNINEENSYITENILFQNYPNPFNGQSLIKFNLVKSEKVNLEVYNILGKRVRNLIHKEIPKGFHSVTWDGRNDKGEKVSSGVYFYKLKASGFSLSRKMLFLQ